MFLTFVVMLALAFTLAVVANWILSGPMKGDMSLDPPYFPGSLKSSIWKMGVIFGLGGSCGGAMFSLLIALGAFIQWLAILGKT